MNRILKYLKEEKIQSEAQPLITPDLKAVVVIPFLNEEELIGKTLKSLNLQKGVNPGDFGVILVDNGSVDNSLSVIEKEKEKLNLLILTSKPGVANARKRGADQVVAISARIKKDLIIINSDADTVVNKSWISDILAAFNDDVVAIGGGISLSEESFRFIPNGESVKEAYELRTWVRKNLFPELRGNWAIRSSTYAEIGGFKQQYNEVGAPTFGDDGLVVEEPIKNIGGKIGFFDSVNFTSPRRVINSVLSGTPGNYFKDGFKEIRGETKLLQLAAESSPKIWENFVAVSKKTVLFKNN